MRKFSPYAAVVLRNTVRAHSNRLGALAPLLGRQQSARLQSTSRLTLSGVEGPSEPPLATNTLYGYFHDTILRLHGDRPALIARSEKPRPHGGPLTPNLGVEGHLAWSFHELDVQVKALARGLVGLGVKKGDRVGVIMGNNRCASIENCTRQLICK